MGSSRNVMFLTSNEPRLTLYIPKVPYDFTMRLAGQHVPTLCYSIQYMERFITAWEELPNKCGSVRAARIRPYVQVGVRWATKYYKKLDNSYAYVISMC